MDSLYSISTLLKRWHTEIHRKDVSKNYMINKLTEWIKKLEDLRHEIMMRKESINEAVKKLSVHFPKRTVKRMPEAISTKIHADTEEFVKKEEKGTVS